MFDGFHSGFFPMVQLDRISVCGKAAQGPREIQHARTHSPRAINGHGGGRFIPQDGSYQSGQHRFRADLDKGGDARAEHVFDLVYKVHRVDHLFPEQATQPFGIVGVGRRRRVGVHRDLRLPQINTIQKIPERFLRPPDMPAVKRCGNRQPDGSETGLSEQLFRLFDGCYRAGHNPLVRGVPIGQYDAVDI